MDEQLIDAIEAKDLRLVEELLAAGANPNTRRGDQTAYQLVPHNSREIKCALIEAGARDSELKTALVWVIMTGRIKAVQTLIEQGTDLNVKTGSGTPIQAAARGGHHEITELLIAAGADVDAGSLLGTPLLDAIEGGHTNIALKLIAAGADPNRTSDAGGDTLPIAIASSQGFADVIQALITAGADINTSVSDITLNQPIIRQESAVKLQTAFGAMKVFGGIIQSLEELGDEAVPDDLMANIHSELATVEAVSTQQKESSAEPEIAIDTFPVIIAARCGHAEALAVLLESGADPYRKDGEGLSAYDWAIRRGCPNVLAVLQHFGVNETQISLNETLLHAAETGDVETVQESLRRGADVNTRDARRLTRDQTALILGAAAGHLTVVQALLTAGADANLTDQGAKTKPISKALLEFADPEDYLDLGYSLGRTALMHAAAKGHAEVVQTLLQYGINPNQTDNVKYTALALAAENNHLTTVQTLITAGAEVNQAVTYGDTPLMLACGQGSIEVSEFLLSHGANVTITNRGRETALMKAAATGSLALVHLCIEWGVDVNATSQEGRTAIAIAADASHYVEASEEGHSSGIHIREYRDDGSCWDYQPLPETQIIAMTQALLQAGADPNLPNGSTTPLIEAARNGHLQLLQVLLAAGARLDIRDRSGDTAVSIAKLYNQKEIQQFLQEYTGTDLSEFTRRKPKKEKKTAEQNRWGEELPRPDFSQLAQTPEYQKAVNQLAELCGSTPIDNEEVPGWFMIHVDSKRRKEINIEDLQQQFLTQGCFVYEPRSHYGDGPENLCILPTTDKYDVIALHQTNGCNCGIGPGYIVQWMKELEIEQPFILTCISYDTLGGKWLAAFEDPEDWAERMYYFCPDIVSQGCGSVDILAEELASNDRLFFWWD